MIDNRKQMVSLRVGSNDLYKVKAIARRLRVRESDVFRFAIRVTLGRLGMFHDDSVVGRDLLPVFMEFGTELVSYFDLDAGMVEKIINESAPENQKVERRDVELVTIAGSQDRYAYRRLKELAEGNNDPLGMQGVLRDYMYDKYMRQENGDGAMRASRMLSVSAKD